MPTANLNYHLYAAGRSAFHWGRRLVPDLLISPSRNLEGEFAIGITTYIERYEKYFKPLYRSLSRCFPEVQITVAVNGHGSFEEQKSYLERMHTELCSTAPKHHRFVLHDHPVGLTTLWNEILDISLPSPVLILNDDLRIYPWMRRWAEGFDWKNASLALLNSAWSHFIVSRETIESLGAFDPGFTGIGFEDMDYTARAGLQGIAISNMLCPYIAHSNHQPKTTSFDNMSERVWGKYTSANQAYFYTKWQKCSKEEGTYIKQIHSNVKPLAPLLPISLVRKYGPMGPIAIYPDRS